MFRSAGRKGDACRERATLRRRRPRRRALVLVLVLIVVMMIALAGFSFSELMLTENKATHLHGDGLQLQQALHSAALVLEMFCELSPASQAAAGGSFDNPALLRGVPLKPPAGQRSAAAKVLQFSVVAPVDGLAQQNAVRFGVENESGRLHLADVLRYERHQPGAGRRALLQLPGMSESVADAILDWIDPDSEPRPLGAENDYYAGLPRPYAVRNGLPETIEELLLVKGVTRAMLYGADSNYNRRIDPEELAQPLGAAGPTTHGSTTPWSWLLTLYSGERNVNSAGQPRINLNHVNLAELKQQLTAATTPQLAAFVVAFRQYGPDAGSGTPTPGIPPDNPAAAPQFAISSILELAGAKVAIPADKMGDKPKVYDSPLPSDPQTLAQQLPKLLDATTVYDQAVLGGLVSVNHAPYEVLLAVPGIDASLAQQIVAARQNASAAADNSRRFATWLLTEGLVDLETMKRLMPYVTGGGDVVRAQIVAYFNRPTPMARAEVVIDATTRPARTILWRDLPAHGPGFDAWALIDETTLAAGN